MNNISKKTISRVLLYIRTLETLIIEERFFVSSKELAQITGISDVKIRKDITHFGKVGKPRVGYNALKLKQVLENFLLHKKVIRVVLFGAGNLGTAIIKYPGFRKGKLKIVAAFDKSKRTIGKTINGVTIYSVKRAPEIIRKYKGDIGIIAVPEEAAQKVADTIVRSGLTGIVNFSPTTINVPENVLVKNIDLSITFLSLYCNAKR
ncbi:MAG: redox-sensing transcriptional repressor Rex [Candidatus Omnitrophica bacterium]|nr:redox-sensing transcriptional repressor Rex [Candidatus Omnitrophota bacterium]